MFLEIRAGTGGDEAALFAGDLFRMYLKYAERNRLRLEVVDASETGIGGYREVIALIEGRGAYGQAPLRKWCSSCSACSHDGSQRTNSYVDGDSGGDA